MSALKPCKACGNMIAKNAKVCPKCGAKNKRNSSCSFVILVFLGLVFIGMALAKKAEHKASEPLTKEEKDQSRTIIMESLSYLKDAKDFSELKDIKINNENEVYIMMKDKKLPEDYEIICNAAAVNASKALEDKKARDTSCTVYLMSYDASPGDKSKALYKSYAKYGGKIQENDDTQYGMKLKLDAMSPQEREKYLQDQKAQNRAGEFEKKYVSNWDGSVKPVVQYVKKMLDDPSSFEHVNTQWGIISGKTDLYWVKMTFRNKNAFNATVTNTIRVNVDFNGKITDVDD